jgi:AcrR family transcriptional regulator
MPRPRTQGVETREKILDVALELFTQNGYDKASLRDIAKRLGITKAALYYYFERKEDILLELHLRLHEFGSKGRDEIEALEYGPARLAAWPNLMDEVIDGLLEHYQLGLLHRRNASAIDALHNNERNRLENEILEERVGRILSSQVIPVEERVRMASAMGAITDTLVENGDAFADVPPDELARILREVVRDVLRVG